MKRKTILSAPVNVPVYDTMPDGWRINDGATTAPRGYLWITNGKSQFSGERKNALLREKELRAVDIDKNAPNCHWFIDNCCAIIPDKESEEGENA